jgi:hypothetical protein
MGEIMKTKIATGIAFILIPVLAAPIALNAQDTTKTYAQALVDRAMYQRPEILVLALHVISPGATQNTIVASNLKQLVGKVSDSDDTEVIKTGEPVSMIAHGGTKQESLVPLKDVSGQIIGSLTVVVPFSNNMDAKKKLASAVQLRDEMQETTPSLDTLFEPVIIAPSPADIEAQCLVLKALAKRPDLMVLAMHVTKTGETVNKMIAINEPRFLGKPSEESEYQLSTNGNILLESFSKTHRLETHVPILTADGKQIGTMATVYFWHDQREMPEMLAKTIEIQRELQPQIASRDALYEPCK